MADLMNDVTNYNDLAGKYANFIAPTVKIMVNGKDAVKSQGLIVYELEVNLSDDMAGSVTFKLADLFDEKAHSFSGEVKSAFKPGTIVEIEMGYLSTTECIFKGYVEMIGAEIGRDNFLKVVLMDAKRLMMSSGRKNVLYEAENYSEIFARIMGAYSSVCSTEIDNTSDGLKTPVSQTGTDYDFIMKDLIYKGRVNREFIILAGKAYFREPGKSDNPIMKVSYGRELKFLSIFHCYQEMSVNVMGVDSRQEIVKGSESIKGTLSQGSVMSEAPVHTIADPLLDSSDKAQVKAKAVAGQEKKKGCLGYGITIGIPEIVPGRYLEVENSDEMINKKYYLTQVRHHYTRQNYTTEFEIGGCI